MMAAPKVSVIIPVHDRPELTRRSLYRWARQAYPAGKYELVVVDDASTISVTEIVQDAVPFGIGPEVQILRLESDLPLRSPNTAYRAGVEAARGSFIVLSSQDVLVPRLALAGLLDTYGLQPERRCSVTVYWLTETMQSVLGRQPADTGLQAITTIPGFWTDITPYGVRNCDIHSGALFILCTGMSREYWQWIGGFRDTSYYGMDDRDLFTREAFLQRMPVTVPDLFCVHQYHEKNMGLRTHLAHPGFRYTTERQARLQEEAEIQGSLYPLDGLEKEVSGADRIQFVDPVYMPVVVPHAKLGAAMAVGAVTGTIYQVQATGTWVWREDLEQLLHVQTEWDGQMVYVFSQGKPTAAQAVPYQPWAGGA